MTTKHPVCPECREAVMEEAKERLLKSEEAIVEVAILVGYIIAAAVFFALGLGVGYLIWN